ncbi:type II secretion system F family protein [Dongia sedimenti]|uniref:Type II secretion system F family protein n=1 Tax=Dongia sedimenti TaxID=3064282 RepID=A0ABU0YTA6_9PROT|nr:type II secretion system F family protein [Rhodospirillaceae bacterium R-7]
MFENFTFGFDLPTVIVLIAFIAAFASVMAVATLFMQNDKFAARRRAVAFKRDELQIQQRESFQSRRRLQPTRSESAMRNVIKQLRLEDMLEQKDLKRRLVQAGWRNSSAPVTFTFVRLAMPIGLAVLAFFYSLSLFPDWSTQAKLLTALVGAAFGWLLPTIFLTNAVQKRQKILMRALPDALDLMVICVESGMSIEAAFNKVSEEMAESAPLMAEEVGMTAAELAYLGDRRAAYENLAERTGLATFRSLTTTLLQSEKYGTPIAQGLRVIAQENRDARLNAAEKKAAALPAQLTVPMIIFFLPVLFIVIAGPAGIQVSELLK